MNKLSLLTALGFSALLCMSGVMAEASNLEHQNTKKQVHKCKNQKLDEPANQDIDDVQKSNKSTREHTQNVDKNGNDIYSGYKNIRDRIHH